jgi:hypothetical protein
VVDVGGAIDHGDHVGDYLQPVGGLHLAAEGKLGKVFHEEKTSVVVFFCNGLKLWLSQLSRCSSTRCSFLDKN